VRYAVRTLLLDQFLNGGLSVRFRAERSGLSQRLADFEVYFQKKTGFRVLEPSEGGKASVLRSAYESLRDLFTEGVTRVLLAMTSNTAQ